MTDMKELIERAKYLQIQPTIAPVSIYCNIIGELADALESAQRTIADQLNTLKALTAGCEAYGLDGSTPVVVRLSRQDERIAELERAVAGMEEEKPSVCIWSQEDEDSDLFATSCGGYFMVNDDTPAEEGK